MPFKIVQTIERGNTTLVIVPSMWEENGNLWWAPKKTQYKLIKEEQSKPDKKKWKLQDCFLKRNNIPTYQLAEAALSIMEENSDTDVDDTGMVAPRTTVVQNQEIIQFELMPNNLICNQENQGNCMNYSNITTTENATNRENIVQIVSTETNFNQILANQKILSDKIENMIQIQMTTYENQQKIIRELATQSVQLEEMSVQLAEIKEGSTSITLLKDVNPVDTESFTIKPIENRGDLISLEQLLADRAKKQKLQRQLSFLCSASKGEGKTCAYKLQDILFTRDFLCNCSWAGGSRGDRSKIALKDYKHILNFFHGMVRIWDPTYTVQENENFFKIITKNSKQRKSMKNLRMSSKRCRKNKDDLDKQILEQE